MEFLLVWLITISVFISPVIPQFSSDLSLFYEDPEGPYPYELDVVENHDSLLLESPYHEDFISYDGYPIRDEEDLISFLDPIYGEEHLPELLSFDGCPSDKLVSGDFEWTGKVRRGGVCYTDGPSSTEDTVPNPEDLQEKKTTSETNELLHGFLFDNYLAPDFEKGGCSNFAAGIFGYTVCHSGKRKEQSLTNILTLALPTYSLENCRLCRFILFIFDQTLSPSFLPHSPKQET